MKVFMLGAFMFLSGMLSDAVLFAGTFATNLVTRIDGVQHTYTFWEHVVDRGTDDVAWLFAAIAAAGLVLMLCSIAYDVIQKKR